MGLVRTVKLTFYFGGKKMYGKKTWLVYLLSCCEMGTEGYSGWMYHSVAFGDTDEEIYNNWIENVKKIYDVDLSKDLKCVDGHWHCHYYPLHKNELKTSVYGHSEPLFIDACYQKYNN
jgi:hypothetical protein